MLLGSFPPSWFVSHKVLYNSWEDSVSHPFLTTQNVPPCPLQSGLSPAKSPGPSSSSQKVSFFLRMGSALSLGHCSPLECWLFLFQFPLEHRAMMGLGNLSLAHGLCPTIFFPLSSKILALSDNCHYICIHLGFPEKQNPPLIIENIIMSYYNI